MAPARWKAASRCAAESVALAAAAQTDDIADIAAALAEQPKIDQRVQELERLIGQIAHGEAGQGNPELHEFLVTLVTQLFEAEAQAKKADKKEAQATAALLANVQAQREQTILEVCTKA